MHWHIRRYQNLDGTLTPEGKLRYSKSDKLASSIYNNSIRLEPKITKDVSAAIKNSGAEIYGLDHKLKTKESLSRKISTDSKEKNISLNKAAKAINDAIRYTSIANDNNYVSSYYSVNRKLQNKGYTEIKCKNYFNLYKQGKAKHKQITSVFSDKHGNVFEIQFQTPSSIKAKELKTPLYEEARRSGISASRKKQLIKQMERLSEKVNDPRGVYKIK